MIITTRDAMLAMVSEKAQLVLLERLGIEIMEPLLLRIKNIDNIGSPEYRVGAGGVGPMEVEDEWAENLVNIKKHVDALDHRVMDLQSALMPAVHSHLVKQDPKVMMVMELINKYRGDGPIIVAGFFTRALYLCQSKYSYVCGTSMYVLHLCIHGDTMKCGAV